MIWQYNIFCFFLKNYNATFTSWYNTGMRDGIIYLLFS